MLMVLRPWSKKSAYGGRSLLSVMIYAVVYARRSSGHFSYEENVFLEWPPPKGIQLSNFKTIENVRWKIDYLLRKQGYYLL